MGAILRPPGPTPRWLFYSSGLVGGAPADSWAASPPAARHADPEPRDPHLQANQVAPIQRAGGRRAPRSTGRPPTALQPLDRLRCRAIAAAAATWCPFRSCGRGRIAPLSAGAYPTCPRRPAARGFSRPPLARGHATRYAGYRRGWFSPSHTPSHARLLHLPPPKIPLRAAALRQDPRLRPRPLAVLFRSLAVRALIFRGFRASFAAKGRSRRPSDAGPRADRAPLCGKSRAAPVPVQQLPGRLTNSEWPVFVPGGAPCLLYRRSRRRSIRGDRSSCFRLRITVR